jgi:hypothetical protein
VQVVESKIVVEKMVEDINQNTEIANTRKTAAETLKSELEIDKKEIAIEKKDAEAIMATALPALEDAKEQMKKVDNKSFQDLKALGSPPMPIMIVGRACLALKPVPDRAFGKGDWKTDVLPMIGDPRFVSNVKNYLDSGVKITKGMIQKMNDILKDLIPDEDRKKGVKSFSISFIFCIIPLVIFTPLSK